MITEDVFAKRLAELRTARKISARRMSIDIGQCAGYISNIENGINYPSMQTFLYICDYLHITPSEFFDMDNHDPRKLTEAEAKLRRLSPEQQRILMQLMEQMK